MLKAVRVNADYKEWREIPNAAPYTFQVTAWANENRPGEGSIISPQLEECLRALVDATKNERSHYTFRLGARFDGGLVAAGASQGQLLHRKTVEPSPVPVDPSAQALQFANATQARGYTGRRWKCRWCRFRSLSRGCCWPALPMRAL